MNLLHLFRARPKPQPLDSDKVAAIRRQVREDLSEKMKALEAQAVRVFGKPKTEAGNDS